MRILGIDPGSVVCGYGVIDAEGNKFTLVEYGVIEAKKKYADFPKRLKEIHIRIAEEIKRTNPDEVALETMFYAKNAQSLMKLSHARAVALLAAAMCDLPIAEYSPKEVKKSVTGNGNAGKEQVSFMARNLLGIKESPRFFDATDALGIAICHAMKMNLPKSGGKSWEDFIKKNPDRIVKI
ncbi:MAG: crossover junction endodeoxyribonuclease RuvC [Candidatus Kapabacteria bacterium]|jgi:crossover junction endodeoxyribonuclease RuvC|nr:crossover junction endodeoxyribonuclease RuvC [Candidatus Kapabacteria bacterium]